ncbi:MAG: VacB/RNase II family 3'-5' exoribonuclease [Deltaproteobacteria bacterium]|nr:VacB/RNase II family 3'-5' exoribonuclease [Deltaproteobacteria bacterium]
MTTTSQLGTIAIHPRGFGFVDLDEGAGSAFVAPPDLNAWLAGDRVRAHITTAPDGRMSAGAIELVERQRRELIGLVVRRRGRAWLEVDRTVANTDWRLEGADDVADGALVVATLDGQSARLHHVVPATEASLERIRVRHGLRQGYPEAAPPARWSPPREARRDLTEVPTVTIDGPTSRDLDDAVAALPAGKDGGLRVLVSIADVDALVPDGSPLDLEARARGTSVYLAGQVLNMLPPALSDDALSLLEGVERPALTAELRLDVDGQVTSVDLYPSVIRSHARLTYDAVSAFLDRGEAGAIPAAVLPTLRWLRTASARLGAMRAARGGIAFLRDEVHLTLDAAGEPTAVHARSDGSANVLIERLMVAANEAVARWLVERGLPGMFRVHEEPGAETVKILVDSARHFGFELGLADRLSPRGLAALHMQFSSTAVAPAMLSVLSGVLGPARYTVHPGAHFGLAAPLYLHFTSPIRRYADLVVHRIVKRYLDGARDLEAGDAAIEALGKELNGLAWRATKAENERQHMLAARLFAGRLGERFAGNVIAVKPFGLVVQLVGVGVSGTVAADTLPDGPYRVEDRLSFVGRARRFAVGDALTVEVAGASEELGRIELVVV